MDQVTAALDQRDREYARNAAIAEARQGRDPHDRFLEADLAWAFEGREDELADLTQLAERISEQKAREQEKRDQARALRRMTERVLAELEADELAERKRRAEKIARERLGLS